MKKDMEGNWNQMRGEVKRRWGRLTENDIDTASGELDKLVGLVQEKYGYTRRQAEDQVDTFMRRYGEGIQEGAAGMMKGARGFVRDYPWSIALAVLVVGVIVGLLVVRPNMQS
jgi:uncharacterized protein YjbJ (UPF0337 family)